MRIGIVGYGKMGKAVEAIAKERGHSISIIIDRDNAADVSKITPANTDAVIEFTQPDKALTNIATMVNNGVPVVSGTTGWLEHFNTIAHACEENKTGFFYASNFSVGVNMVFYLNQKLAELMNNYPEYGCKITETHHTQKKDSPSGTAITLAEGVLGQIKKYEGWAETNTPKNGELPIEAFREENVVGIHHIIYESEIDKIELSHMAKTRKGFATGAVLAAEWLPGRTGTFGMFDLLGLK